MRRNNGSGNYSTLVLRLSWVHKPNRRMFIAVLHLQQLQSSSQLQGRNQGCKAAGQSVGAEWVSPSYTVWLGRQYLTSQIFFIFNWKWRVLVVHLGRHFYQVKFKGFCDHGITFAGQADRQKTKLAGMDTRRQSSMETRRDVGLISRGEKFVGPKTWSRC